ncbi:MAG: DUF423 domain-containing protein [Gammaproteobacteria bacterium]|nr:DUF423 domain-containing protein [Gammaproteobacteria bacterium]
MNNKLIPIGAILAMLAVAFGAFGAHALKGQLDSYYLEVYKTGVLYHLIHSLGIVLIGIIAQQTEKERMIVVSGYLMSGGVMVFSGSLYLLAISGQRWLGAITPIGGILFILAWGLLALATMTKRN